MLRRAKLGAILLSILVTVCTCTYRANDPNVCFTEDILPIYVSNCAGCHSGKGGNGDKNLDFTNYDGIMQQVVKNHPLQSDAYTSVNGSDPSMPPSPNKKLTSDQLFKIKAWISMGAPNSSNCSGCDTSKHAFTADIKPIINSWCVTCHTTGNAGGGYDLSSYSGVASCVATGKFLGSIKHTTGISPMPKNSPMLSTCDITKIQNWINAGYPNN